MIDRMSFFFLKELKHKRKYCGRVNIPNVFKTVCSTLKMCPRSIYVFVNACIFLQ